MFLARLFKRAPNNQGATKIDIAPFQYVIRAFSDLGYGQPPFRPAELADYFTKAGERLNGLGECDFFVPPQLEFSSMTDGLQVLNRRDVMLPQSEFNTSENVENMPTDGGFIRFSQELVGYSQIYTEQQRLVANKKLISGEMLIWLMLAYQRRHGCRFPLNNAIRCANRHRQIEPAHSLVIRVNLITFEPTFMPTRVRLSGLGTLDYQFFPISEILS